MSLIIAVDTGGTFTDIAAYDLDKSTVAYAKALTTYDDLVDGVMACVAEAKIDLGGTDLITHGTTLVINTLLQRKGAEAALVTTKGFRDTLELARGNRTNPFQMNFRRDPPLIPRPLRFEVSERIHGSGEILKEPERQEIEQLARVLKETGVQAVAISLINSYIDDVHEAVIADLLRKNLPGIYVTAGTELTREWYEYERCCTAAANAIVGPDMSLYTTRLRDKLADSGFHKTLYMMGSNGGVLSVERSLREPISLIESGPVGGCIGAGAYGEALDIPNIIAFDMGGTTAKCSIIRDGEFSLRTPYFVGGYDKGFPIRSSVVDIVEVGAGGGSIAWIDNSGRLNVGPRSAGSDPGPVAFGRGGTEPTVTDANLVLGRIAPDVFLGGGLPLNLDGARVAIGSSVSRGLGMEDSPVEEIAEGILSLSTVKMTGAIRQITVERGDDPKEFALFVFGGSGPIFGSALARELNISRVIIPPEPGNFSALGMLLADARLDVVRTMIIGLEEGALEELERAFSQAEESGVKTLKKEVLGAQTTVTQSIKMRYRGQKHTFTIPITGPIADLPQLRNEFEKFYKGRFGHSDSEAPVEIVGIHVSAYALTQKPDLKRLPRIKKGGENQPDSRRVYFSRAGGWVTAQVYRREFLPIGFEISGPAVIEEYGATTVIEPRDHLSVGKFGEMQIAVGE